MAMAGHVGVRRWSPITQVGTLSGRGKKDFCVRAAANRESQCFSARDDRHEACTDHYTLLGISSDATPHDIKLAFRQLARKYHPDVNSDAGAANAFKTIRAAYETLSDRNRRYAYDHSLRSHIHAARQVYRSPQHKSMYTSTNGCGHRARDTYWNTADDGDIWDLNSSGCTKREFFDEHFDVLGTMGRVACENESSGTQVKGKGPSPRKGWAASMVDNLILFSLVGFIWHALGVELALTYFVFFIPHKEQTPLSKFASLLAWLVGGTKGLALQYGIITAGWLYGKGYDVLLAVVVLAIWMEAHFPQVFTVPRGALLLLAHLCFSGLLPH